jgi:hypothetical protein
MRLPAPARPDDDFFIPDKEGRNGIYIQINHRPIS